MGDNDPGEPEPEPPPLSPRLSREYVWGPGDRGVDELLVQFDEFDEVTLVLQDAGGDCVALCDLNGSGGSARVVAQWTYDPYGQVLTHQDLYPHAWLRAGHKGLFVDRLDAGVSTPLGHDLPRLVAGADLLVHNRNRTYKPDLGRFMQQDPNASGLVLIGTIAHSGAVSSALTAPFDVDSHYADGVNVYQYIGSNPTRGSDPLGLFMFDAVGAYFSIGFTAGRLAFGLATAYAENMEWDLEWATDWSQGDDWHSRSDASWIDEIYEGIGIHDAVNGQVDPFGVFASAGVGRRATEAVSLLRHGRRLTGSLQLHHVLPRYFRYIIDKASPVGTKIRTKDHHKYHVFVSRGMQRDLGSPAMNAGKGKWKQWINDRAKAKYGGDPGPVKDEVRRSLQGLTDTWGNQNGYPGLGDVLRQVLQ